MHGRFDFAPIILYVHQISTKTLILKGKRLNWGPLRNQT